VTVTLGSMCLSLLQVFTSRREYQEVLAAPGAGGPKGPIPLSGRISNALWDRSVSSNHLYRAVSDLIIAELTLPGVEHAQRRTDTARHHS
jgi:hypothetical protein